MRPAWMAREKMPLTYRIVLCIAYFYAKIFLRLTVKMNAKPLEGPALIAANHTSYLDPIIVSVSFPEEVHFIARKGLFDNRLFGALIRRLNAHPISGDGKDMAVFRAVSQIMESGKKTLLFPEGQRSFDGELDALKPGVALMAIKNNVPVIPCWVEGTHKVWPRGKTIPRIFGKVTCIFGEPIYPPRSDDTKANLHQMIEELKEALLKLRPR